MARFGLEIFVLDSPSTGRKTGMTEKVFVKDVYCELDKRLIDAVYCYSCGFYIGKSCDYHAMIREAS